MQYRTEFFDIFNHTQGFNVNGDITVPNANSPLTSATRGQSGIISNARDPRNVLMALKLLF